MTKKDLILLTKLQPPKVKGKVLRRERLINNLEENLHKKLILICAGAGYGKTTLLAQFCEAFNQPYVYYDIDAEDNDLATFLDYLISGVRRYSPDFGKRIKSIIPQVRDTEIVIGTFINEFTERVKKNFYIILDDYHHLQKNIEVAKNLDYLLRYMPDNLHIIIASRSTPPLNLSYYSSKQELFQIEKEHLQFTIKELELLLKNIYGLTLPKTEVTRIAEHSEGWVTAIQLILQKIYAVGVKTTEETINSYLASGEEENF
jgi:LuxR family maltose regulon positive regulatory protein